MIARMLLAVIAAGLIAGVLMTGVQQARLVPLIEHAEIYENGGHDAASMQTPGGLHLVTPAYAHSGEAHGHDGSNTRLFGVDRYAGSIMANLVVGAGYALLLAAVVLLTGNTITARTGVLWGAGAWLAVHLLPAFGLPPELPAMPAADLTARQIWWLSTVAASGAGIYLMAMRPEGWAKALGVVLVAAPQIVGAPQPPTHESPVPAGLAAAFAASALATTLFFWLVLGGLMGLFTERFATEEASARAS
ncbi:CbtA family protein [Pararhizobium mangrovi]|uniref:Cobalt transporter n=1 Tax=Pararhizobium mangrovi TaxID=2590452 RepID=A0A506U272_9HYPH|nr:CbtA family protein [Pararhizobium mangrovi]TPW27134.1 cobalt transporter [Pararhizobium mangrovi]